jgi:hypothetical protein
MEENRKLGIIGGIGLLVVLIFLTIVTDNSQLFFWGLPIGVIFGVATSVYLSEAWDPHLLKPTNPNTKKASWKLLWVVPLGVLAANLLPRFLGEEIGQLLSGCTFAWIIVTFGYFIIQAWRYRPK